MHFPFVGGACEITVVKRAARVFKDRKKSVDFLHAARLNSMQTTLFILASLPQRTYIYFIF
jgi:hypothetical protein